MASFDVQCSRCHRHGHNASKCERPFLRTETRAEERVRVAVERAERKKRQELEREERERSKAEYEERKARRESKQAKWQQRMEELERKSTVSVASLSTTLPFTDIDVEEVAKFAEQDRDVRKYEKVLRDIAKLECHESLDALQTAKVAKKEEVTAMLNTARGLAEARARCAA